MTGADCEWRLEDMEHESNKVGGMNRREEEEEEEARRYTSAAVGCMGAKVPTGPRARGVQRERSLRNLSL
jgi:hypothetical protein